MSIGKIKVRKFTLSLLVFVAGTFSVTISNIFNGRFALGVVVEMVAATMYLSCMLDEKNSFKTDLIDLTLMGIVVFTNLLFFITNDIVGKDVYVGNLNNFWDVCVIGSQFVSLVALVYILIMYVIKLNRNHVEVIEKYEQETFEKIEKEDDNVPENGINMESPFQQKQETKEVKSIEENNIKINTPFMEEEN